MMDRRPVDTRRRRRFEAIIRVIDLIVYAAVTVGGVITLARKGVSGREDKRRDDIIAQRDFALAERDAAKRDARDAEDREDAERARRIRWQNYAGGLEYLAHYAGIRIDIDRPDDTTSPAHPKGSS